MAPLGLLLWGIAVVFLDLRVNGFDFLVDLVGWLICYAALRTLSDESDWFRFATWGTLAGALLSIRELLGGTPGPMYGLAIAAATTGVIWCVCTAFEDVLNSTEFSPTAESDPWLVRLSGRVKWGVLLTSIAIVPLMIAEAGGFALLALLVYFAAGLWFIYLVWKLRDHPAFKI